MSETTELEHHIDNMDLGYAQKLCDATEWFEHSRALIASARISKKQSSILINRTEKSALDNVSSLMYGLAMENLFKAIWIYRKFGAPYTTEWLPEAKFPKEIKTHDLVKLAKIVDPELIPEYELSLQILTEATVWSGRYPCEIKSGGGGSFRYVGIHDDAEKIYEKHKGIFTISS
jgi:hypothetical protein